MAKGTLLRIKYSNNEEVKRHRGATTLHRSLINFKTLLKKHKFDWAVLYHNGKALHYFHKSTGTDELTLEDYNKALVSTNINLYIIYNYNHKVKKGNKKAKSIFNSSIEKMKDYFNEDVLKIRAYQGKKVIAEMTELNKTVRYG